MVTNPNWPDIQVLADFTAGPPSNVMASPTNINTGDLACTDFSIKRGHQYELDTFQAGTCDATFSDPSEKLNPANTSSPFNSGANALKPYRMFQITATWAGTTYTLYTGYIERYPQGWDDAGGRGVKKLSAVDALSIMSRMVISQSYDQEIAADAPMLYMPLNDAAPPGDTSMSTVNNIPTVVAGGALNFGGDSNPDGTPALNIQQTFQDPSTIAPANQYTMIDIKSGAAPGQFSIDLGGATLEFWFKMTIGAAQLLMQFNPDNTFKFPYVAGNAVFFGVANRTDGFAIGGGDTNTTTQFRGPKALSAPDDTWHHVAIAFVPNATNPTTKYDIAAYLDGALLQTLTNFGNRRNVGINSLMETCLGYYGDPLSKASFSRVAIYNYTLSATRINAHYVRGVGHRYEYASNRAVRLLTQWWAGGAWTVAEASPLMLAVDFDYNGRILLDVLQEIASADGGRIYADRTGRVQHETRYHRDILSATSIATFGEQETPYDDVSYDFDPTVVYSQTSLTRPGASTPRVMTNTQALTDYGQRILSASVPVAYDFDLDQIGIYILANYSSAKLRIETLTLNPAANPTLWPIVLGLEISQRVTVKRRTSAGTVMTGDHYVESIDHEVSGEGPSWITKVQLSPVILSRAGILDDATYGVLGTTTLLAY